MEKTVADFSELKAAIEDNETTEVILSADIAFSGGIKIPTTKKSLVINGDGHTITDNVSSAYTDTVYIPAGAKDCAVTLKNAVWSGRNYYGIICVYDDSANAGVIVTLENVTYNGPQAIYNRYGTTVVKNCSFEIAKNGSSAAPQEFAECNRIIFEGNCKITSQSTSNAVIWFPYANAAFTVEANASVTVSAPNTYMFYTDSAAKPPLLFKHSSSTSFTMKKGLFYAAGSGAHIASSVTVEQNAKFLVATGANGSIPVLKCGGALTVASGAEFRIISAESSSAPLVYFSTAATVSFSSPKSVLLYSNGGKVFSFGAGSTATPNTVSVNAEQINVWQTAKTPFLAAGGFDDTPFSSIKKADGKNATVTAKLSQSATLTVESNLESGDSGFPISASTFDLTKAAVFSAGSLALSAQKLTDISTSVDGTTDESATVKYAYGEVSVVGSANENGAFSLPLSEKLEVGRAVEIFANKNFLTQSVETEVGGSVSVTGLSDIPFPAIAAPYNASSIKRIDPDWFLELTDTRPQGGNYELYLTLSAPLTNETSGEIIENAVNFSDETGKIALSETALLVKSGTTDSPGIIRVSWKEAEGVLLEIKPDFLYEKGKYSATLTWHVLFD